MLDMIKPLVTLTFMPLPVASALVVLGMLLVFVSFWAPVADRLLGPLEWAYVPMQDPTVHTDVSVVVVAGSGSSPRLDAPAGLRLTDSSALRLLEGLRLVEALPESLLVVTGASRRSGHSIAAELAEAARDLGFDSARIVMIDTPVDTAQEAYAVREIFGEGARVLLVTSAAHMPRAVRHFERVGLEPIPAPTKFKTGRVPPTGRRYWLPSAENLHKTERALYEYMGLLALELDHWGRK